MPSIIAGNNGVVNPSANNQRWDQNWGSGIGGWNNNGANNGVEPYVVQNVNTGYDNMRNVDLFGAPPVQVGGDVDDDIDVPAIIQIIKQAVRIYDSGKYDKKIVATEVDTLRSIIENNAFDAKNSEELKSIFGYILGDVVAELFDRRPNDYDCIVDTIMASFPSGTGNPPVSKYAGSKYGGKGYGGLVKKILSFERANNLSNARTLPKFDKIFEQFKIGRDDCDNVIIPELYKEYRRIIRK